MRIFLGILLLICSQNLFGQNDSIIIWNSDYQLKVSDFKGELDESIRTNQFSLVPSAVSYIGYTVKYEYKKNKLLASVETYFNRNESFYRDSLPSSLLEHEQCHFNIMELYVRKMRKEISTSYKNGFTSKEKYDQIIDSVIVECDKYNDKFDFETYYGSIESTQNEWIIKVKSELNELNEFKHSEVN
jgi:hypothetical protein